MSVSDVFLLETRTLSNFSASFCICSDCLKSHDIEIVHYLQAYNKYLHFFLSSITKLAIFHFCWIILEFVANPSLVWEFHVKKPIDDVINFS